MGLARELIPIQKRGSPALHGAGSRQAGGWLSHAAVRDGLPLRRWSSPRALSV